MTVSIPNDSTSFGDWPLSKSLPELPGAFGSLESQELGIWGPALLQKEGHHGEGLYHPDNGLSKLTLEHLNLKHSTHLLQYNRNIIPWIWNLILYFKKQTKQGLYATRGFGCWTSHTWWHQTSTAARHCGQQISPVLPCLFCWPSEDFSNSWFATAGKMQYAFPSSVPGQAILPWGKTLQNSGIISWSQQDRIIVVIISWRNLFVWWWHLSCLWMGNMNGKYGKYGK